MTTEDPSPYLPCSRFVPSSMHSGASGALNGEGTIDWRAWAVSEAEADGQDPTYHYLAYLAGAIHIPHETGSQGVPNPVS